MQNSSVIVINSQRSVGRQPDGEAQGQRSRTRTRRGGTAGAVSGRPHATPSPCLTPPHPSLPLGYHLSDRLCVQNADQGATPMKITHVGWLRIVTRVSTNTETQQETDTFGFFLQMIVQNMSFYMFYVG